MGTGIHQHVFVLRVLLAGVGSIKTRSGRHALTDQQHIKRMFLGIPEPQQGFNPVQWRNAEIAQTVKRPLYLQSLFSLCVGDQDSQ